MSGASTAGSPPNPLAVGTLPSITAGRAGSSSWSSNWAPGTRLRTSAACCATPSASDSVRSATALRSARATFWLRASSIVAASVHGPQTWIFSGPWYPSAASSSASRSPGTSMVCARRMSRPGRSVNRHRPAVISTGSSISSAAVRPVRSAPGPRSGSSARCGKSGSSPRMIRVASAGSVPGMEPTPVALAGGHGNEGAEFVSCTLLSLGRAARESPG